MSEFWNKRYSTEKYVYGTKPNDFFKQELLKLPKGKILLPAEGEGRNAVFAAKLGWDVVAFDSSKQAKVKAEKLANKNKLSFEYIITDIENADFPINHFDCIGLFYAHQNSENRERYHKKLLRFLKQGGTIILEAFTKQQFGKLSGGPDNIDMLYSEESLRIDFAELKILTIIEKEKMLDAGKHKGMASIVNITGIK